MPPRGLGKKQTLLGNAGETFERRLKRINYELFRAHRHKFFSVQPKVADIYALGKARMRFKQPFCQMFPQLCFKTVPMSVGLAKDRSRLFREDIGTYLFLSEVACEACEE